MSSAINVNLKAADFSGSVIDSQRKRHSTLWFEDGSIVISLNLSDATYECRVHREFLTRLSPTFLAPSESSLKPDEGPISSFPPDDSSDLEKLLLQVYHMK